MQGFKHVTLDEATTSRTGFYSVHSFLTSEREETGLVSISIAKPVSSCATRVYLIVLGNCADVTLAFVSGWSPAGTLFFFMIQARIGYNSSSFSDLGAF